MYLQQFDFQVEYCKGTENAADYLSRHSVVIEESDVNRVYEASLSKTIMSCVPRALSLKDVQEATAKDKILSELIIIIISSKPWEIKKKHTPRTNVEEYSISGGASSHDRNIDGDPTGTPGSCPQHLPWGTSRHCEEQTTPAFQSFGSQVLIRKWKQDAKDVSPAKLLLLKNLEHQ